MSKFNIKSEIRNDALASGNTSLIQYLDAYLSSTPEASVSAIRGITDSQLGCVVNTCAAMIDESFTCANGIENDVTLVSNDCCPVNITVGEFLLEGATVPANGDITGVMNSQFPALECITVTPVTKYVKLSLDSRNCYNGCLSQADLITKMNKAMTDGLLRTARKEMFATLTASAGASLVPAAGSDMADSFLQVFNAVNDLPIASGKTVTIYANNSAINRLNQVRDDNGQFLQPIGRCPVTGCQEFCYAGMRIKEVDKSLLPIVTGQTDIYAVIGEAVKATLSPVRMYSIDWTSHLNNKDDVVYAEICVGSRIPALYNGAVAKLTVTL